MTLQLSKKNDMGSCIDMMRLLFYGGYPADLQKNFEAEYNPEKTLEMNKCLHEGDFCGILGIL